MLSIELLIFDLDGTLCDTKRDIATAVNLTLRDLDLPQKPEEIIYQFVGNGVRHLIRQSLGLPPGPSREEGSDEIGSMGMDGRENRFREAMEIFRSHYRDHLLDTTKPYDGIEQVLDHFDIKKKAVVTNKPQEYTEKILDGLGLTRRFMQIASSRDGIPLKPHPQMIHSVLDSLKVMKDQTVMIGDGLQDIEASHAAGIKVCAVGYGLGDSEKLRKANPDFYSENPEDLMCLFE